MELEERQDIFSAGFLNNPALSATCQGIGRTPVVGCCTYKSRKVASAMSYRNVHQTILLNSRNEKFYLTDLFLSELGPSAFLWPLRAPT